MAGRHRRQRHHVAAQAHQRVFDAVPGEDGQRFPGGRTLGNGAEIQLHARVAALQPVARHLHVADARALGAPARQRLLGRCRRQHRVGGRVETPGLDEAADGGVEQAFARFGQGPGKFDQLDHRRRRRHRLAGGKGRVDAGEVRGHPGMPLALAQCQQRRHFGQRGLRLRRFGAPDLDLGGRAEDVDFLDARRRAARTRRQRQPQAGEREPGPGLRRTGCPGHPPTRG